LTFDQRVFSLSIFFIFDIHETNLCKIIWRQSSAIPVVLKTGRVRTSERFMPGMIILKTVLTGPQILLAILTLEIQQTVSVFMGTKNKTLYRIGKTLRASILASLLHFFEMCTCSVIFVIQSFELFLYLF
jgi:hypothetical protein